MSDGDEKRKGPLWKFVPMVAHVASARPQAEGPDGARARRELGPDDLRPLRWEGEWSPSSILRRFQGAAGDAEYLSRLLVACAVVQGPHRIRDMVERLVALLAIAQPRIERMVDDESLARRHDTLKDLMERIASARREFPSIRARATNDMEREYHPDGLRELDLELLVEHTNTVVLVNEASAKRNLTGIDFALHVASNQPDQGYAEDWLERSLGTADLAGILLFTPAEYGRVVVVYNDGRLAYDPLAPPPEETEG